MNMLLFSLLLAIPATAHSMNFDDLFAGGNDPFAGMFDGDGNGGFGDFGDMFGGDNDPFAGMFGDDVGGDPFSPPPAPGANKKGDAKKEAVAKKVKNANEAFKTALPEGVAKLPKLYKQGLDKHLGQLNENLHNLSSQLSGFSLGISTREKLQKQVKIVAKTSEVVDQIRTQSIYHQALYAKEFNSLRNRIMNSKKEFTKALKALIDLEEPDSLELLSARDRRKQDGAFRKAESLINRTVKPLEKDLQKVLDHAISKKRLDSKKKKYSDREKQAISKRASSSSPFGGWGGSAGGYFGDSFGGGFGGGSGWDFGMGGGGGGWDSMFGGGSGGFGGFGGSSGGWGGSSRGGYGGNSWGSSSSKSSSPSSSSSSQMIGGSGGRSSFDSDYYSNNAEDKKGLKGVGQYVDNDPSEELPIEQRLPQLARKMTTHLENRLKSYNDAANKNEYLKKILAERSFVADMNRMITITQLQSELAAGVASLTSEQAANVARYEKVLIEAIPVIIDAAKYAQRPLERLEDEQTLQRQHKKMNKDEAKRKAAAAQRTREQSHGALIKWLYVVRQTDQKALKKELVSRLQKIASGVLEKLDALIEKNKGTNYITYEDSEKLVVLSQQLLQEPIVIGYSSIPHETTEQTEARKDRFSELIAQKKRVEANISEVLTTKNEILITMRTIVQTALEAVRETVESKTTMLTDPTAMNALNKRMEEILDTDYLNHPAHAAMKQKMVPYTDQFFQQLEVQVVLHEQLAQAWAQKPEPTLEQEVLPDSFVAEELEELDKELPMAEVRIAGEKPTPRVTTKESEPFGGQLFSTDDVLAMAPAIEKDEGFLSKARNMFSSSPLAAKAAEGAGSFAKDLAKGIVEDTKGNLRRGASQAVQRTITSGVNRLG